MNKQLGISKKLKGICITIGIILVAIFGYVTSLHTELFYDVSRTYMWVTIVFTWVIAILCFDVLLQFWKVCSEIGKDNSFSKENVALFNHMKIDGIILSVVFTAQAVVSFITDYVMPAWYVVKVFMILMCIIFSVICSALAKLIDNAYEMKHENELTI